MGDLNLDEGTPRHAEIDAAIGVYLSSWSDAALSKLVAHGPAALLRVIQIWYGYRDDPEYAEFREPPNLDLNTRERLDLWTGALYTLVEYYPDTYLDQIDAGRIRLDRYSDPLVLALIDDPRAVTLLVRYANHDDWQTRMYAVRGHAWRDDAHSVAAVEAALKDAELGVRLEAPLPDPSPVSSGRGDRARRPPDRFRFRLPRAVGRGRRSTRRR